MRFALVAVTVAAAGCGSPNAPGCEPEGADACRIDSMTVRGVKRTFVVSNRGSLDCSAGKVPVVFAFHGFGDTGSGLRSYLGLEDELQHRALVVYPDGLGQAELFLNTGWNRDQNGEDVAFFDAMRTSLAADNCLDTEGVFSVGHSRGGRMVEALSCARSSVHRAFLLIAAGTDPETTCDGTGPAWLSHGTEDRTVPYAEGVADLERWARRNGCDPPSEQAFTVDQCTELTNCRPEAPVVWCPSTVTKWNGHAPAPFAAAEMAAFLNRL